jgi:SAM-dependent methyltransferase
VLRLNLGCGSVCHPDWVNLDTIASRPDVVACDLRRPLPFADAVAEACYASHVLEHLNQHDARCLLDECHRLLRPGGILRIVVPDLEGIATAYLKSLAGRREDHRWMILEMVDQLVRTKPGGEMHALITSCDVPNVSFIVGRVGMDAEQLLAGQGGTAKPIRRSWRHIARRGREELAAMLAAVALGREGRAALREGLFRRSGQVHLWMYDRVSLADLIIESGFASPRVCQASESDIAGFLTSNFDVVNGRVRKPDSLFMEATKP